MLNIKVEAKKIKQLNNGITIGGTVMAALLLFITVHFAWSKPAVPVKIKIHQPSDRTSIECTRTTPGGELVYPVSGTIDGKLPPSSSIYLFIQQEGGDQWWISGQPLRQQNIVNGTWEQKWATFGSTNSPPTDYVVSVVVSSGNYRSGQNFSAIPADVLASDTVRVSRK